MDFSDINLACLSIDSGTCIDIICGSNGLPLTPNSIKIIGNFKAYIEHVEHNSLVKYVECFRNKNERVTLVFECLNSKPSRKLDFKKVANQLLNALDYMHNSIDCVHGLIEPDCFVWTKSDDLKINHWAINLLTSGGFILGSQTILTTNLSYMAPELVKNPNKQATKQSDIWSAGLTLLKLMKPNCKIAESPCRLAFCDSPEQVLSQIEGKLDDTFIRDSSIWNEFFSAALHPDPHKRASLNDLYEILSLKKPTLPASLLAEPLDNNFLEIPAESKLNIDEIYYLWRLSIGRNLESEQKQDEFPPIFKIPYLIVTEKRKSPSIESKFKVHTIIDTRSKRIALEKFKSDIERLDTLMQTPFHTNNNDQLTYTQDSESTSTSESSISRKDDCSVRKVHHSFSFADLEDLSCNNNNKPTENQNKKIINTKSLPIVIKEADFAYQFERLVLFKNLISGGSSMKSILLREASSDIPPFYRAQTWAILLDVPLKESKELYESIDKTVPPATDRQISVDIPRCHQYNELMASPQGHEKLARILKAWLNHHSTEYVYWQGLDSLAAPFLLLNFDNEAMAFGCFNAFVNKYLHGFFRQDNQVIVQQYLSVFSELLAFHDASMANHLEGLGFLPNLYAIPWFLTMFTHALPLHKILHVWDHLLLGNERYPLCVGLAILNQLRQELMGFSFNDCIVAFSDLPEIDIERCIKDATYYYESTPDDLLGVSKLNSQIKQSNVSLMD